MVQLQKRLVLSTEKPVYISVAAANVITIPRAGNARSHTLAGTRFHWQCQEVSRHCQKLTFAAPQKKGLAYANP
jgi:hypothetical protein